MRRERARMPERFGDNAHNLEGGAARRARATGLRGEDRAAGFLSSKGYSILARNFRTRAGEIDIIAEKSGTVAFVEVKTWNALSEADLEFSIDQRKRRRIVRTARMFIARERELAERSMRFDVLLLSERSSRILHIENAFSGSID